MEKTEPHSGLPRLAFKIGAGGFAWIKARLAAEVTNPTTRMGRTIHALTRRGVGAVSALPRSVRRSLASGKHRQAHEILFAFYDLKVAPVTFDFLWFLAAANLERRRRGLNSVHVVIVPGPHNGVREETDDYNAIVDAQTRHARIYNILVQACRVLPSCSGLTWQARAERRRFCGRSSPVICFPWTMSLCCRAFQGRRAALMLRATESRVSLPCVPRRTSCVQSTPGPEPILARGAWW